MTIAIGITNKEPAEQWHKELIIEHLRPDGTVHLNETLKCGETKTVYVHLHQSLRLSERFSDKFST